jgi:hypothetical protein
MRVNRGGTDGGSADQSDGAAGISVPSGSSGGSQGSGKSGGMREPSGGGSEREGAGELGKRTDRGNQKDEDVGSSASRGADLDPIPDTDVTGTTDALGG